MNTAKCEKLLSCNLSQIILCVLCEVRSNWYDMLGYNKHENITCTKLKNLTENVETIKFNIAENISTNKMLSLLSMNKLYGI